MNLHVIIPAYNAAKTLPSVIDRLPDSPDLQRIWIIDDGSKDRTSIVMRNLAETHHKISPLFHEKNKGYGGTVKTGLRHAIAADAEMVACVHADGQYAPELAVKLSKTLLKHNLDILQGSRHAGGTALDGGMPRYKLLAGKLLTSWGNSILDVNLTDLHSGYMIYGPRALRTLNFNLLSNSFDFDLEVIASSRQANLIVGESPIPTHYGDEISYLNPFTYGLRVLKVFGKYSKGGYRHTSKQASPKI